MLSYFSFEVKKAEISEDTIKEMRIAWEIVGKAVFPMKFKKAKKMEKKRKKSAY